MGKCPICGKEYDNNRRLNAHMLKAHIESYRAHDCKLANYGAGDAIKAVVEKAITVPADLRPLNLENMVERQAYNEGFRYISGGECYTSAEVKEKGWL